MPGKKVGITFAALLRDLRDSAESICIHLGEAHKVSGTISRVGSDIVALTDGAEEERYFVPNSAIRCIEILPKKEEIAGRVYT